MGPEQENHDINDQRHHYRGGSDEFNLVHHDFTRDDELQVEVKKLLLEEENKNMRRQ
jgi:hypothetical protein